MTTPTPAAPVTDPTTPPAAPATPDPAPAAPPAVPAPPAATDPATPPVGKLEDLPDFAQKMIRDLRAEAAEARVKAKGAADELTQSIGKALGLIKDDEPIDAAKLQQTLAQTQDQLYGLKIEQAVNRAATKAGAAADLVTAKLAYEGKLDNLDPASSDFATKIDSLISEAVAADPRLKATPGAAPIGGAPNVGGGSAPTRIYTREQLRNAEFFAANRADILAAQAEGRIQE